MNKLIVIYCFPTMVFIPFDSNQMLTEVDYGELCRRYSRLVPECVINRILKMRFLHEIWLIIKKITS